MLLAISTVPSPQGPSLPTISDACTASGVVAEAEEQCIGVAGGTPAAAPVQGPPDDPDLADAHLAFKPAVKPSKWVKASLANPDYAARYQRCVNHALHWPKTRLQGFYKAEYNSLRSRKQGAKARHLHFDDRLKDFRDWLIHLGPQPAPDWTVHRPNNYKGYQPGNVTWATKQEQTEIRTVTRWHDVDGKQMTTQKFAKFLGITYSCLYKRLQNGWSVQRLLDHQKKNTGMKAWQFPDKLAYHLEPLYRARKKYHQTRLEFYIGHLKKKMKMCNVIIPEEEAKQLVLEVELLNVEDEYDAFRKQQKEKEESELDLLFAVLSAPKFVLQAPGVTAL